MAEILERSVMNDEQINIAIAEVCGWKVDQERKTHGFKPLTDGCRTYAELPDYCNDLNAMHEAEKFLLSEYGMSYCTCLTYLIGKSVYASIHATARQRAEAFLRTLGKWKK